jgi:hypothetical protein
MDYILQGHELCFQFITDMLLSTCATLRARLTSICYRLGFNLTPLHLDQTLMNIYIGADLIFYPILYSCNIYIVHLPVYIVSGHQFLPFSVLNSNLKPSGSGCGTS